MTVNFDQEKYLDYKHDTFSINDSEVSIDSLQIIDFHTHLSGGLPGGKPSKVKRKPQFPTLPKVSHMDLTLPYWTNQEWLNQKYRGPFALFRFIFEGILIYKDMVSSGSESNLLSAMASNGIQKSVVLPISTEKKDVSRGAIQSQKAFPQRLIAFCSVHPSDDHAIDKIHHYHALGAKGLKLKITNREIKQSFKALVDLLSVCSDLGMPVLFHTGTISNLIDAPLSSTMSKIIDSTAIDILDQVLEACPNDLHFIFGHSGIGQYKTVARLMKTFPSTYAELSSQSTESIQYLIEEVGYERLLFGSDWPALPQAITLSRVLEATENHALARDYILHMNAKKLLGLPIL